MKSVKSYRNYVWLEITSRPHSMAIHPSQEATFCVTLSSNTWVFQMCFAAGPWGLWGSQDPFTESMWSRPSL